MTKVACEDKGIKVKTNLNNTVPYQDEAVCAGKQTKAYNYSTQIKQSTKSGGRGGQKSNCGERGQKVAREPQIL